MNIIDMVDVEYLVKDNAYSISLPVYYKKETSDYLILFDVEKGTTLSATSKDIELLEKSLKETIINYYENER